MSQRRSPIKLLLMLLLGAGICLGSLSMLYLSARIPNDVNQIFGPASKTLSTREQMTVSIQLWLKMAELTSPADTAGVPVKFAIQSDEPTSEIIQRLESQGLIRDGSAFRYYLIYSGFDSQIQAGEYQLSASMTGLQIAEEILDATSEFVTFNVLAGWRLEEIAAALPSSGLAVTAGDFLAAAQNYQGNFRFSEQIPAGLSVEGFLFPGSYELPRGINAQEMVGVFVQRFESEVDEELLAGLDSQGLTLREAVILASVVEREAVLEEEQRRIAGVFLKRFKEGIPLEADPCVQYALGFNAVQQTWWTNPLSADQLTVDSPYNTYRYAGLPPGPISNPSLEAIMAVAYAEENPYYYFRATCDGSGRHLFATTFEEHLANACAGS